MSRKLKVGAFVVTDAHYSHLRPNFLNFLKDIHSKKLNPTQLIFLGDIFDMLFGGITYTYLNNKEAIELLNEISKDIEIIYLEGNHDFNLKNYFPNISVFSIKNQPVALECNSKKILLAHGDIQSPIGYRIYVSIIRNSFVLFLLNKLNILLKNKIIDKIDSYLCKKEDCNDFIGFRKFIEKRLYDKYDCDYFIEGHFHQNKSIKFDKFIYINIGAFACNQRYFCVKSLQKLELTQKNYS